LFPYEDHVSLTVIQLSSLIHEINTHCIK
jgi:hypothetical protein